MKLLIHFLSLSVVSILCSTAEAEKKRNKRPNIVILLADDLGIGDVGCYGNDTIKTPNIDMIAREGVKLSHHLSAAAVCTPSRAALLTGRYPVRQGMESSGFNKVLIFVASQGGLPPNETTFAKVLKESEGYRTALIGKWHLGMYCRFKEDNCHHPLRHGFDHFYGLPLTNLKDFGTNGDSVVTTFAPQIHSLINAIVVAGLTLSYFTLIKFNRLKTATILFLLLVCLPLIIQVFFRNFKTLNGILMRNYVVVEQPVILEGLTQRLVNEATSFINGDLDHKNNNNQPFLLVLSFVHVHTALFTAQEFVNKSLHGRYGDNVEELDWAVGQILQELQKNNIKDETFVYFSSDNGAHLEEVGLDGQREGGTNGRFKGGKCMGGMDGGIRVPSMIMYPGVIPPGREINIPTSQMDLFPTLLELTGSSYKSKTIIDGKSLLPMLTHSGQDNLSPPSSLHHKLLFHYCGDQIHALRYTDDYNTIWKVHYYLPVWLPGTYQCRYICPCFGSQVRAQDPPLVFNLSEDPFEDRPLNVTGDPKLMKLLSKIKQEIQVHLDNVESVPSQFTFQNSLWKPWLQPCCNFPYCSCVEK